MSVIIRLQRLPWTAAASDLRQFFAGLHIPDGGVHIVGGREGDAFIAFATDEDARQAMRMDGKKIKDTSIKLLLSSRVEMQKVIEKARSEYAGGVQTAPAPSRSPSPSPERPKSPTCFEPQPAVQIEQTLDMAPPPYLSQALAGTFTAPSASISQPAGYSAVQQALPQSSYAAPHTAAPLPPPQPTATANSYSGYVGQYQGGPPSVNDPRGPPATGLPPSAPQGYSATYQQPPVSYSQQPVSYNNPQQQPYGQPPPSQNSSQGYMPPVSNQNQSSFLPNVHVPAPDMQQDRRKQASGGYSASYTSYNPDPALAPGAQPAQNPWNYGAGQNAFSPTRPVLQGNTLPPPPFMSPTSGHHNTPAFPVGAATPSYSVDPPPSSNLNEPLPSRDQRLLPPPNFQSKSLDIDPFVNSRGQQDGMRNAQPLSGPVGFTPERPPPGAGGPADDQFYSPPNAAASRLARQPSGHSSSTAPPLRQEESIPGEYDRGGAGAGYHGPYGMAMKRRAMENQRNQQTHQPTGPTGGHGRAGFSAEPPRMGPEPGRLRDGAPAPGTYSAAPHMRDPSFGSSRDRRGIDAQSTNETLPRDRQGPDQGREDDRSWMNSDNAMRNNSLLPGNQFRGPMPPGGPGMGAHPPQNEPVFQSMEDRWNRPGDMPQQGSQPPHSEDVRFPPMHPGFQNGTQFGPRPSFNAPRPGFDGPGGPRNLEPVGQGSMIRHPAWASGGPPIGAGRGNPPAPLGGDFEGSRGRNGPMQMPVPMGPDNLVPLFPGVGSDRDQRSFRGSRGSDRGFRPRFDRRERFRDDGRPDFDFAPSGPGPRRYRAPLLQTPQRPVGPPGPSHRPPGPGPHGPPGTLHRPPGPPGLLPDPIHDRRMPEDRHNGPAEPLVLSDAAPDILRHRLDRAEHRRSQERSRERSLERQGQPDRPAEESVEHMTEPPLGPANVDQDKADSTRDQSGPAQPKPLIQPNFAPQEPATPLSQIFNPQKRSLLGDANELGHESPPPKLPKSSEPSPLSNPEPVTSAASASPLTSAPPSNSQNVETAVPPTQVRKSRFDDKRPSQPLIAEPHKPTAALEPAKININSVATVPSSSCIRMSNVRDADLRYAKVREFFRPIQIKGQLSIKLIYDRVTGHRKNQFYVRFLSNEDACRAIADHQGRQGVLLERISNQEFEDAEDGPPSISPNRSPDHRPAATLADVVALVNEAKPGGQEPARQKRSLLGSPSHSQSPTEPAESAKGPFLILVENLPFRFTEKDIQGAFGGKDVVIVRSGRNSTGRAFVEFSQKQEMDNALRKDMTQIGGRRAKVHPSHPDKMFQLTGQRPKSARRSLIDDRDARKPTASYGSPIMDASPSTPVVELVRDTCVLVTGAPPNVTVRDIFAFFEGLSLVAHTGVLITGDSRGSIYVEFRDADDVVKALNRSKQQLCGRVVAVRSCAKVEKEFAAAHPEPPRPLLPNGAPSTAPRMQLPRPGYKPNENPTGPPPGFPSIDPAMARTIGNSGCVIALHSLPSDVTLEEICELFCKARNFSEFGIIDESVRMHYNPSGQPTGDCLLAVRQPSDAARAVRSLHMRFIRGNTLAAYVVPC